MKKQRIHSTPFGFSLFPKGVVLLLALWIALTCACQGQAVQLLRKGQPFPFSRGAAMDSVLYNQLKAKLDAAEQLRTSSAQSIASLKQEIAASKQVIGDQQALMDHDAHTLDSLQQRHEQLQTALRVATDSLDSARRQFSLLLGRLPRSYQTALRDAPTHQLASVIAVYITDQRKRKWHWLGIGSTVGLVVGFVGSLVLIAR